MSIVDPGSVLILGAGSSKDFGLPLGGELIDLIRAVTTKRREIKDQWGDPISIPSAWPGQLMRPKEGLKNPIGALLNYQHLRGKHNYVSSELDALRVDAFQFGIALSNQTSDTIDDFISLNPALSKIAKRCIAAIFGGSIFVADESNQVSAADFSGRMCANGSRNWIHLLINIARHRFRGAARIEPIKIISFNYDGILERVLQKQLGNVEERFEDFERYFEIVHPHGYCGAIPDQLGDLWGELTTWSDNIWVVNEPPASIPANISAARDRAKELIGGAKRVYAAGFSFARPNCKLIGLYDKKGPFHITYHNFGNEIGVDLAVDGIVAGWGIRDSQRRQYVSKGAGSEGRNLTIADWIRAGYLGEMPG